MATTSEPAAGGRSLRPERHCSQESHGRRLTTTPEAAVRYRAAQAAYRDRERLLAALRGALGGSPGFAGPPADLAALAGGTAGHPAPPLQGWERHHVEVV